MSNPNESFKEYTRQLDEKFSEGEYVIDHDWISHKLKNQVVLDSPWRHCYVDDFLPEESFNQLQSDMFKLAQDDNPEIEDHNTYKKFSVDTMEYYNVIYGLRQCSTIWGESVGKNLAPYPEIIGTGVRQDPGVSHYIHPDVPPKIVTGILYVSPNREIEDLGTWIYEEGDDNHQVMETTEGERKLKLDHMVRWIPNRFVTVGVLDNSWHSLKNKLLSEYRITLVFNLYDRK